MSKVFHQLTTLCKLSYSVKETTQLVSRMSDELLMLRTSMTEGRDNFAMLEDAFPLNISFYLM